MGRAIERADFEAVWERTASTAVEDFNRNGEVSPKLFMLTLGDEPGEVRSFGVLDPALIHAFFKRETDHGKDAMAALLRLLLTPDSPMRKAMRKHGASPPDVLVQVNEAWVNNRQGKTKEQVEAEYEKYGSVEAMPDRTECVWIGLHTHGYSTMGICPILDNPRRAEIGKLAPPDGTFTGRFSMTSET
ncbi:hypothetical protein [Paraburkholderia sp. MM6662-R1]|uniref:hypothetical protein n=1 Tax=Paraburkholderia sp. MM6662-R1 TaxID=2991066 RepID=UPI003D1E807F